MNLTDFDAMARAAQRFRQFGKDMPLQLRWQPSSYAVVVGQGTRQDVTTIHDTAGAARRRQQAQRFKEVGDGKLTQPPTA